MTVYRCSSLPLLFRCPAAAQRPELLLRETSAPAEVGTAAHLHLQRGVVETGDVEWSEISSPEVRSLVAAGAAMWRELRDSFPGAVCERSLSVEVSPGVTVTGHTDVQAGMVGTARVLDWKSGRVDHDYREQLLGYAALVMLENSYIDRVETHIAWLREREVEHYYLDRSQLPAWCARVERLSQWSGAYHPGDHCEYCPRAHECPGHRAVVRRDVAAFTDLDVDSLERGLASMPPDRIIELVRVARRVGRVAERAVEAARSLVTRSGDVVAEDGTRLTLDVQQRRSVDAFAAWPILQDALPDRELALCVDVRLGKVEDAVAAAAPPRQGAAAKRALAARLEDAGAIRVAETRVLKERRS